jgi:hypothetical protein
VYKGIKAYRIVIRKLEGKKYLRRPRHRQEDGVDVGCEDVDWFHLVCDRFQSGLL